MLDLDAIEADVRLAMEDEDDKGIPLHWRVAHHADGLVAEVRRLRAGLARLAAGEQTTTGADCGCPHLAARLLDGAPADNIHWCFMGHHAVAWKQLTSARFPDGTIGDACYKCEAEAAMREAGVERPVKGIDKA